MQHSACIKEMQIEEDLARKLGANPTSARARMLKLQLTSAERELIEFDRQEGQELDKPFLRARAWRRASATRKRPTSS